MRKSFKKFPLMADVKIQRVTLDPGQCLYIPPFWWTQTRTHTEISRLIQFDYNPANELAATFMRNIYAGRFVEPV